MKSLELKSVEMKESIDYIGFPMLLSSFFFNLAKLLAEININFYILLITSIGGLIYIIYKISNVRKEEIKTNMEIENQRLINEKTKLEIEKLNKN